MPTDMLWLDYMEKQYANRKNQSKESARILERLKALEGDPDAFFKMGGILGKPRDGFSWDELREYPCDTNSYITVLSPAEYLDSCKEE